MVLSVQVVSEPRAEVVKKADTVGVVWLVYGATGDKLLESGTKDVWFAPPHETV